MSLLFYNNINYNPVTEGSQLKIKIGKMHRNWITFRIFSPDTNGHAVMYICKRVERLLETVWNDTESI